MWENCHDYDPAIDAAEKEGVNPFANEEWAQKMKKESLNKFAIDIISRCEEAYQNRHTWLDAKVGPTVEPPVSPEPTSAKENRPTLLSRMLPTHIRALEFARFTDARDYLQHNQLDDYAFVYYDMSKARYRLGDHMTRLTTRADLDATSKPSSSVLAGPGPSSSTVGPPIIPAHPRRLGRSAKIGKSIAEGLNSGANNSRTLSPHLL